MEWLSRRRLGLLLGLALALASLLAVVSFAPQDPTLTNLRYPKDGIGNWLGFPGALLAGSLVEAFGWAALAVPAAALYWTLCAQGRPRLWRYALQTAALLALAASWSGQWTPLPALGLASPGVVGWMGARWARQSLGPEGGAAVLTVGLALAVWRQLYAPGLRAALRPGALARLLTEEGWQAAGERVRDEARLLRAAGWSTLGLILLAPLHAVGWVAGGAAAALGAVLRSLLRSLLLAPLARALGGMHGGAAPWRRTGSRSLESALVARRPAYGAFTQADSGAAFDPWLAPEPSAGEPHSPDPRLADPRLADPHSNGPTGAERLAQASRAARSAQANIQAGPREAPQRAGGPELPPAGSGAERWEQLLRRYRENLDLDWDGQWHPGSEAESDTAGRADDGASAPRRPK